MDSKQFKEGDSRIEDGPLDAQVESVTHDVDGPSSYLPIGGLKMTEYEKMMVSDWALYSR